MTARREYELTCDGPPGAGPFDCPIAPIFARSAEAARAEAKKAGWVSKTRAGKHVDLCPDHKNVATPRAAQRRCADCGKDCRVTLGGMIRSHKRPVSPGSSRMRLCPGSGRRPAGHSQAAS